MITATVNQIIWRQLIDRGYRVIVKIRETSSNGLKGECIDFVLNDYKNSIDYGTDIQYRRFLYDIKELTDKCKNGMFIKYIEGFKDSPYNVDKIFECVDSSNCDTYIRVK